MSRPAAAFNLTSLREELVHFRVHFNSSKFFLPPFEEHNEVFKRYKSFPDPELINDGRIFIPKKNYLKIENTQDQRDEEFARINNLMLEEVSEVCRDIRPYHDNIPQDIADQKAPEILATIIVQINEYLGDIIPEENALDEESQRLRENYKNWENRLIAKFSEKLTTGFSFLEEFIYNLNRTLFYRTHNSDASKKTKEERLNEFEKIKAAADMEDCVGGASGALEELYILAKHEGHLWPLIKEHLLSNTPHLRRLVLLGNNNHLRSWLDFLVTGKIGADELFLVPTSSIVTEDVRRIIELLTVRSVNLVADFVATELQKIIKDAKSQAFDEEAIYETFQFLQAKQPQLINEIEIAEDDPVFSESDEEIVKSILLEKVNSFLIDQEKTQELSVAQKDYYLFWAEIIIAVNSFASKLMPIPAWLQNIILSKKNNQDDFYIERINHIGQAIYERELTEFLQKKSKEVSDFFGTNLPILTLPSLQRMQGDQENLTVVRCAKYLQEKQEPFEVLCDLISIGASFEIIESYLIKFSQQIKQFATDNPERKHIDIRGLAFNPNQDAIIHALRENNLELNENVITRAILVGEANLLIKNSYLFCSICSLLNRSALIIPQLTFPQIQFVYSSLNSPDSLREIMLRTLTPEELQRQESEMQARSIIQMALINLLSYPVEDHDGNQFPLFFLTLKNSENKAEFLNWIIEEIGPENFITFFIANQPNYANNQLMLAKSILSEARNQNDPIGDSIAKLHDYDEIDPQLRKILAEFSFYIALKFLMIENPRQDLYQKHLEKSAASQSGFAMLELIKNYLFAENGYQKNGLKAEEWIAKAYEQNTMKEVIQSEYLEFYEAVLKSGEYEGINPNYYDAHSKFKIVYKSAQTALGSQNLPDDLKAQYTYLMEQCPSLIAKIEAILEQERHSPNSDFESEDAISLESDLEEQREQ